MPRPLSKLYDKSIDELAQMLKIKEPTDQELKEEMIKRDLILKIRHKKYYDANREKLLEQKRIKLKENPEFREKHKEYLIKFREKNSFVVECDCGSKFKKANVYTHELTKKHLKYLEVKKQQKPENLIEESVPL